MSLEYWAFVVLSPGFAPERTSHTLQSPECRVRVVGLDVHDKESVVEVARELVADGVQAIELCGGFGPRWVTEIGDAIDHAVPVGSVMYGPEYRKALYDLMPR